MSYTAKATRRFDYDMDHTQAIEIKAKIKSFDKRINVVVSSFHDNTRHIFSIDCNSIHDTETKAAVVKRIDNIFAIVRNTWEREELKTIIRHIL